MAFSCFFSGGKDWENKSMTFVERRRRRRRSIHFFFFLSAFLLVRDSYSIYTVDF
jgi:hypothetical protein